MSANKMKYEVLVFGFGLSSQKLAAYLQRELLWWRVDKVVLLGSPEEMSYAEVERLVFEKLRKYVGMAEVIVMADVYISAVMKKWILKEFPEQKFVWRGDGKLVPEDEKRKVCLVASARMRRLEAYQQMKIEQENLNYEDVIEDEIIQTNLTHPTNTSIVQGAKVIIFGLEALKHEKDIEKMAGWQGEVSDLSENVLRDVLLVYNKDGGSR